MVGEAMLGYVSDTMKGFCVNTTPCPSGSATRDIQGKETPQCPPTGNCIKEVPYQSRGGTRRYTPQIAEMVQAVEQNMKRLRKKNGKEETKQNCEIHAGGSLETEDNSEKWMKQFIATNMLSLIRMERHSGIQFHFEDDLHEDYNWIQVVSIERNGYPLHAYTERFDNVKNGHHVDQFLTNPRYMKEMTWYAILFPDKKDRFEKMRRARRHVCSGTLDSTSQYRGRVPTKSVIFRVYEGCWKERLQMRQTIMTVEPGKTVGEVLEYLRRRYRESQGYNIKRYVLPQGNDRRLLPKAGYPPREIQIYFGAHAGIEERFNHPRSTPSGVPRVLVGRNKEKGGAPKAPLSSPK